MSNSFLHFTGAAVALLALLAAAAADCGFHADCRPGETYRVAIPCDGKCASYVQCADGEAAEKKCGKFFFTQKYFDPVKLDCVRDAVDCDWWKKVTTSTAAPTPTTTAEPETTPSTASTETTPTTSTEASSTTTASPDTTPQPPSTTPTPSSSSPPPPPAPQPTDSAAAPLAAAWPALFAAAVALAL
ncbi:mucin-2-like [Thrips palmi]|uniref:Mucin-2-like n=1 Tax=Thrips palmi TaxID=161013 RepID=A0A6P8ZD87_THRPL|nr:mucin-2-like [Thrips palmi]